MAPGEAEIADQRFELAQAREVLLPIVLGELDEQHRIRLAAHEGVDGRAEHGDVAGELDHGAVDELDRDRLELDDVLGRSHRIVEAREVAGADRAPAEQRPQLELDPGREAERAFRADENVGEVVDRRIGRERIEIVAADPALHFRKARRDLVGFAQTDGEQILGERAQLFVRRGVLQAGADGAEMRLHSVGEDRVDREDIVAGHAIAQRARPAGIVAGHAADGGARGRRDVDRKPQPVTLELAIEVVEHDAGLDDAAPPGDVEIENVVEVFRAVEHQRVVDRLAALRRSAAPCQHRHLLGAGDGDGALGLGDGARSDDPDRHHLVMGGVGRIAAAGEAVEPDLARELRPEPSLEPGRHRHRHSHHFTCRTPLPQPRRRPDCRRDP